MMTGGPSAASGWESAATGGGLGAGLKLALLLQS
jgi:hypothetical protein